MSPDIVNDPIVAIATPLGRGAIGIVRMSGEGVLGILGKVWKSRTVSVDKLATHRLYLGNIVDFSTENPIDRVMVTYMRAPHSYTGEDVVEISCHGGPYILKNIMELCRRAGARPAEPGEFTRRAFMNGRMDLAQAEAVAALIESRSSLAAKVAEEQLEGKLSKVILDLEERLKRLMAIVEASIDFPEEDIEFIKDADVQKDLSSISSDLAGLIGSYDRGRIYREGVKTVIAGPPNAGKSSLLNTLLGRERAIVHHVPGTTRDTIEEDILLEGVAFRLVDTAGIREAEAEVEEIGVDRSKKAVSTAEVVLLVVDGHDFVPVERRFLEELEQVRHVVVIVNKKDLGLGVAEGDLKKFFGKRSIYTISALTGDGVDSLLSGLAGEILEKGETGECEDTIITSRRHFDALNSIQTDLKKAGECIEKNESAEFIAHHLRGAMDDLGRITGRVTTDDILNEIFSTFCIGK